MAIHQCSVCGHIEFDVAPESCLVCHSAKDAFAENADAIKQPADPAQLTEGEKKHIPVVSVSDGVVQVTVGEIEHVMQREHFIQYIDVFVNKTFASRTWLAYELCKPCIAVNVAATEGSVQVIEHCNVHGNWMAEATL